MQFSAIITLLATATAVFGTAIPNAAPDAAPAPSPNGQPPATNKCSQGTSTQCCDKTFLSGIGGLIGINCLPVNVLSGGTCSPQQQLACCSTSGNSVINIGPICPNILVL